MRLLSQGLHYAPILTLEHRQKPANIVSREEGAEKYYPEGAAEIITRDWR